MSKGDFSRPVVVMRLFGERGSLVMLSELSSAISSVLTLCLPFP
jgi:hypothetical protein